ncbi:MAG: VWA domain-containing protein, partial [Bacteroidota bacterium]
MDWLHPAYLWALAAVPVAVGLALYAAWRRRQALAALGEREVVDRLTRSVSVRRRRYKSTVVIIALGLLALALAGPRIGSKMVDLQREGVDLVIALDVSESMLAQDVLPSRLAKAKFEIGKLVDDLNGDRVGLVLFAGDAFAQCPLTLDYSALRLFLDIADPSLIPTPGTNFNAAINEAVRMFETEGREAASIGRGRALLIVSDGENHVDVSNSLGAL